MNETLKGVANIGAELAAAKAELQLKHEAHRKTWRQLEQVTGLLSTVRKSCHPEHRKLIDAALSLQAEPALTAVPDSSDAFYAGLYKKSAPRWHRLHDLAVSKGYDHVRFAIECAPVYKCDCMGARKVAIDMEGNTIPCECVAAANEAEPAPAQDEQSPIWGYAGTIGNLIAQLRTLDPDMEIFSPHRLDDGRILLDGLTLSREWKEGRWLRKGDEAKRVAVLWTQPDARPAQAEQQPEQSGLVEALIFAIQNIVHDDRVPNEVSQDLAEVLILARRATTRPA